MSQFREVRRVRDSCGGGSADCARVGLRRRAIPQSQGSLVGGCCQRVRGREGDSAMGQDKGGAFEAPREQLASGPESRQLVDRGAAGTHRWRPNRLLGDGASDCLEGAGLDWGQHGDHAPQAEKPSTPRSPRDLQGGYGHGVGGTMGGGKTRKKGSRRVGSV